MSDSISIRRASVVEIVDLRHRVLRAGLPPEEALFAGDELASSAHYAAITAPGPDDEGAGGRIVGCATFHLNQWEDRPAWQLRGMAVDDTFRGTGVGRLLLTFAERDLMTLRQAPRMFWCNARTPAIGFYRMMGWEIVSAEFEIPTAGPHFRMCRKLG